MERARMENGELNRFFNWAYRTRGNTVKALAEGQHKTPEKVFLSFTSHDPVFISHGPAGLNGSAKSTTGGIKKSTGANLAAKSEKKVKKTLAFSIDLCYDIRAIEIARASMPFN